MNSSKRRPKIYKITNDINNKVYVGQTWKTEQDRFNRHCAEARWKNIKYMPIVLAIQKYGPEHFKVELLETLPANCDQKIVDKRERWWSEKLNSMSPSGYNLRVGNAKGRMSEETKIKIGKSNTGKKATPETIKKLSISHMGYKVKQETKDKLSRINKGKRPCKKAQINAVKSTQKTYELVNPKGKTIAITNMAKFCKKNGLNKCNMSEVVNGWKQSYKGWTSPKRKRVLNKVPRKVNAKTYVLSDPNGKLHTTTAGLKQFCRDYGLRDANLNRAGNGYKGWKIVKRLENLS